MLKKIKMDKLKKTARLFVITLIITTLFSCDNNEAKITFNVIGDVFITKRYIGDEEQFAVVYYAYGNQIMSSATVTPQGGDVIELEPMDASNRTYGIQPDFANFSPEFPETATFDFKVVSEGIEFSSSDILLFDNLEIPVVTNAEFNTINETVMVEWESVDEAQSYIIKMTKDNGDILFVGQLLGDLATSYEIDPSLGSWLEVPQYGTSYNVEVHAYLYDPEAGYSDYMYHIQENSVGSLPITWGEQ